MSILEEVLEEELERINRIRNNITNELNQLPSSYLSKKIINGKEYYYEQKREGDKVKSKYINKIEVEPFAKKVERRQELEKKLNELDKSVKQIKKVIGKDKTNE
ncbi:MAG: hypothetical protein JJE03_04625 [Peptostreptococcaceae bacterium]|nr:hypothetical protein [Peptostreptococcaceae bacterium]